MEKFIAGADVGYGQVKIIFGNSLNSRTKLLFPSVVKREEIGRVILPGLMQNATKVTDKYWLDVDGTDVQIGENAGSFESRIEKSIISRNYDNYKVMTLGSLAMLLQEKELGSADICLTIGTPKTVVDEMKKNLISILSGEHDFKVCWFSSEGKKEYKNIHMNINKVDVFEQGVGAFVSLSMLFDEDGNIVGLDKASAIGSVAVIDFGTYTTNFVYFANGRYESRKSKSIYDFGTVNIINMLRDEIFSVYGIYFPPHIINKLILINDSKKILIGGENEGIDVTELKSKLLHSSWRKLSKYIKDSVESAVMAANQSGNTTNLKIVFTGGGSKLFATMLKEEFTGDKFVYSRDPIFDNALGFFIAGYFASKE